MRDAREKQCDKLYFPRLAIIKKRKKLGSDRLLSVFSSTDFTFPSKPIHFQEWPVVGRDASNYSNANPLDSILSLTRTAVIRIQL